MATIASLRAFVRPYRDNGLQFSLFLRYPPFHPSARNYRVAPAAPQSLPLPPLRRTISREDNAEPVAARGGVQPATRTVVSRNFTLANGECIREWSRANVPILRVSLLSCVSRVASDRTVNLAFRHPYRLSTPERSEKKNSGRAVIAGSKQKRHGEVSRDAGEQRYELQSTAGARLWKSHLAVDCNARLLRNARGTALSGSYWFDLTANSATCPPSHEKRQSFIHETGSSRFDGTRSAFRRKECRAAAVAVRENENPRVN
ncbi:hypothetical protein G5I_02455 [Acromyrmex echinatior]|uniref:Uncharacterized protein n=1 Tax=Acromyrmex echinatior TaxID=103372 RepID=F4WAB9_ACREC|nr:hypothetical protein G5I_02455 [Acromyrmex echinatior]